MIFISISTIGVAKDKEQKGYLASASNFHIGGKKTPIKFYFGEKEIKQSKSNLKVNNLDAKLIIKNANHFIDQVTGQGESYKFYQIRLKYNNRAVKGESHWLCYVDYYELVNSGAGKPAVVTIPILMDGSTPRIEKAKK